MERAGPGTEAGTEAGTESQSSSEASSFVALPGSAALEALPSLRPSALEDVPGDVVADWGPGFSPVALAFDGFGALFVLDSSTDRIYRWDPSGQWSYFGVGDQGGGRFASLRALEVRGPDLFALDSTEGVLYRFGLDGRFRNRIVLGREDLGTIDAVDFVIDQAGELWVLDRAGRRLLRFGREGEFLADLAVGAAGRERLASPTRIALDASGGAFVLEPGQRRVMRFSRQGELLPGWSYAPESGPPTDRPSAGTPMVDIVASRDEVVLVDAAGRWARSYTPTGSPLAVRPLEGSPVSAAILSADGVLHLALPDAGEVARIRWKAGQDDGAREAR